METRYYYRRIPEDKFATWQLCTKPRAEKRQVAAFGQEAFYNLVISLTETYPEIPDKGFVLIREIETKDYENSVTITLTKKLIFGGEDKEYRARIALDIFSEAYFTAFDYATRQ